MSKKENSWDKLLGNVYCILLLLLLFVWGGKLISAAVSFMQRGEHPIECVSGSSCCLHINQGFTQQQQRDSSEVTCRQNPHAPRRCCGGNRRCLPDSAGSPSASAPPDSVGSSTPSAPPGPPGSGGLTGAAPCPTSGSDTGWRTRRSGSTHLGMKHPVYGIYTR